MPGELLHWGMLVFLGWGQILMESKISAGKLCWVCSGIYGGSCREGATVAHLADEYRLAKG